MKRTIATFGMVVLTGLSTVTWAGKDDHVIVQEAAKNVVTVSQVAKLKDETGVTLTGQITKHLQSDHYEFKDQSGTIGVEIDDDIWRQAGIKVGDHVRLVGEVDTHRYKPTDIEVIKIEKHLHK
ncbi:TIGR00156 family protein [Acinetobacter sp. ANC 3929]|uniref:NirD/YgiW/YdeI family stress tolerance protein n=1 Tax=unclassified Acinetobacter TaxID=196816 RepID=UPI0002CF7FF2|nr:MULTISPECIES: NirD/YgiW/YdeI family stress tolerance protein [unclassified Acinetobacter]ENW79539.1 TIGR00156 family protein [Acinetobacter sp. ANC 3929]MCH7351874.1 NirD/YgiW/YdeI family stress tolerance protein [Acinetobacter sp. NIPH 2023]MCH7356043.1 NirD/YgiW/YdeI family stress tolerance protein [Acinetobacter sp. NIPH 1958]MCH7359501.1 NirD/YgiW/YdeI family stress tolerance protein [Acinetobacter sp. NIPH 2024]